MLYCIIIAYNCIDLLNDKLDMKAVFTLVLALTWLNLFAQDKIVKRNGDTLRVSVTKSTPDVVEFTYPNETTINSEYKNALTQVIYSSGRIEDCSSATKLATITGPDDWEKVLITNNPDDVRGLTKLGEVSGKSGWGGLAAQGLGDKDARKKMKKNAAKVGAAIVLLQDKPDRFGVKLIGVAYK